MMKTVPMRTRASLVLSVVALIQLILLGLAVGFLVLQLGAISQNLTRIEQAEQEFLTELGDAESDLYRTSILLRDNIILEGEPLAAARGELAGLLERLSRQPLHGPSWMSPAVRLQLDSIAETRREYLARARTVLAWGEKERHTLGPDYVSRQLAPMREKFVGTAHEISGVIRSLRESRNRAMAGSIDQLRLLAVRVAAGAALLGLVLYGFAVWRFDRYEKEREVHTRSLEHAEDRLRALSLRLVGSQELERKKLSRELHDDVGQILTALRLQLGQIQPTDSDSRGHLAQASELAERSLRSVRGMARDLRPAMLDDLGLAPALKWLGRDISKNTPLEVDVEIHGEFANLDEQHRTCLYRVVQEALTNCVKHSGSQAATVVLEERSAGVALTVRDRGAGFGPDRSSGIGLLSMRERVEELGGGFAISSTPGGGTVVRAELPASGTRATS